MFFFFKKLPGDSQGQPRRETINLPQPLAHTASVYFSGSFIRLSSLKAPPLSPRLIVVASGMWLNKGISFHPLSTERSGNGFSVLNWPLFPPLAFMQFILWPHVFFLRSWHSQLPAFLECLSHREEQALLVMTLLSSPLSSILKKCKLQIRKS